MLDLQEYISKKNIDANDYFSADVSDNRDQEYLENASELSTNQTGKLIDLCHKAVTSGIHFKVIQVLMPMIIFLQICRTTGIQNILRMHPS